MQQKLMSLFKTHLQVKHNIVFYPYQLIVAEKIFAALIQNLRLTSNATEEDIKKLKVVEIPIEFSRQAGKTTAVVHAIDFVMLFFPELFKRPIRIGIFAPQREQAKTDFDRLKFALAKSTDLQVTIDDSPNEEENNAKTIVLPNGASCYIFPVTPTSKPESKSLDLIVFEESQDLDDKIIKEQIWPMGASTNAARVYIGTAGTRICYFYRLGQSGDALKLYYDQIAEQRRSVFKETSNALHLVYEQSIKSDIEKHGRESDEISRPYFGKWLIGTGQFSTQEDLEKLFTERKRTYQEKQHECYVGIDSAKIIDSTVVTILRYNKELKKKQVVNWLELRGDNYVTQFQIILEFLSHYKVVALAIDSTGQGDFLPDMFQDGTEWQDENSGLYRVKFSAVSKDMMYKNLKVSIKELLTDLPEPSTREAEKFKQQMLDLQQEYKGQLLSVHHPDVPNAHDDYPDSWALAEWAYARYNENNNAQIIMVSGEKEREPAAVLPDDYTSPGWE